MIGFEWWKNMVNAARFLEDAEEIIEDGKSVVLSFQKNIPWLSIMIDELLRLVSENCDARSLNVIDTSEVDTTPGEYLFENFCKKETRHTYWEPVHINHIRFLSSCETTTLNSCFLCVTGINNENINEWEQAIEEYHETCKLEEHCAFILVAQGEYTGSSPYVECLKFSDYTTDYDCMLLCLNLALELKCSRLKKMYLAEVASNIADNNVEIAGLLVSEGEKLIKEPFKTTKEVFEKNCIKYTMLREKVSSGVWEAQIKLIFPRLEDFRVEMVQKYKAKLKEHLPFTNGIGEIIREPNDLEIGQIYALRNKISASSSDKQLIEKMRGARNEIAHHRTVSFDRIRELGIF